MAGPNSLAGIARGIVACERCPRLIAWCRKVAIDKKRAHRDETYWGRPIPGFGDPRARLLVVGLAPAAHGGNRTGRMFTGDSSGDWLYRALHGAGFASQPTSVARDDGLELSGAYISAGCRCAPPDNRPTREERGNCAPWLGREFALLAPRLRVIVALGAIAWETSLGLLGDAGAALPRPRPRFGHGAEVRLAWREGLPRATAAVPVPVPVLLGSYHPSRQNTNTGRLTRAMLDTVFARARVLSS